MSKLKVTKTVGQKEDKRHSNPGRPKGTTSKPLQPTKYIEVEDKKELIKELLEVIESNVKVLKMLIID